MIEASIFHFEVVPVLSVMSLLLSFNLLINIRFASHQHNMLKIMVKITTVPLIILSPRLSCSFTDHLE